MYNDPLNRPMFQKKVPGYRNGGGIAYLANGGRPNIPVSGERTRIRPLTVNPPSGPSIPTNRSLVPNPVDEALKNLNKQRSVNPFKGLNFKNKLKKGIGSVGNFVKQAGPIGGKALGKLGGIGALLYNIAPVPSFRLNESNPIRSLDVDPTAGSIFRNPLGGSLIGVPGVIGSYDALREIDRQIQEIESLGDNMTTTDIRNLERLRKNKDMATRIAEGPLVNFVAGKDRSVLDNTIDTIVAQLTSGTAARLSGAKLGEINTAKGVADILDKNRDQLVELMQAPGNAGLAKELAPKFSTPEGLKEIAKMLDIEAYEKIFPAETAKEKTKFDFDKMTKEAQEGMQKAIDEEKRKEALKQRIKDNQSTMETFIREERIKGKPLDPKIEEKALIGAMYGGGPDATAFDYVKNADATRVLEEEKAAKLRLEQKKALGSGYEAPKSEEIVEGTGINISFFQPKNPTLRGAQEIITDNAYTNAAQQITSKLDVYAKADSQLDQLASILEAGNPTRIGERLKQAFSRVASALGNDFEQQTDSAKYDSIQKLIQAAFTSEFLNESGRTISDRDRQLVRDIFADISRLSSTGINIETLKMKLEEIRAVINKGARDYNNAFTRINLANPKMAAQFARSDLTSDESAELDDLDAEIKAIMQQDAKKYG